MRHGGQLGDVPLLAILCKNTHESEIGRPLDIGLDNGAQIAADDRFAETINDFLNLTKSKPLVLAHIIRQKLPASTPELFVLFLESSGAQERIIWNGPDRLHEALPESVTTLVE